MTVKFLQNHTHLSNNWNAGDKANLLPDLAGNLIAQNIAKAVTNDCGCGE